MSERCRSCEAEIKWITMASGKAMPVDVPGEKRVVVFMGVDGVEAGRVVDTYTSHFVTCPDADKHRRNR